MQRVYSYSIYIKYTNRWPNADRGILLMQCRVAAARINRRRGLVHADRQPVK